MRIAVVDVTNSAATDVDEAVRFFGAAAERVLVRATQFHEFAGMVVEWTRSGGTAVVPPVLVQPVAAVDVGEVLAEVAAKLSSTRPPVLSADRTPGPSAD